MPHSDVVSFICGCHGCQYKLTPPTPHPSPTPSTPSLLSFYLRRYKLNTTRVYSEYKHTKRFRFPQNITPECPCHRVPRCVDKVLLSRWWFAVAKDPRAWSSVITNVAFFHVCVCANSVSRNEYKCCFDEGGGASYNLSSPAIFFSDRKWRGPEAYSRQTRVRETAG